jgi:glutathione reductase (NADPH)
MGYDYDLFVLGAGSGGLAASKRAARYGAKVAIAERDLVGGTCVIRGCVPKKLMVYASEFAPLYREAVAYGWEPVQPAFHWNRLQTAVDTEVRRLSRLHITLLEKAGVELLHGNARLLDEHTVAIDGQTITADKILIAVGGKPVRPDIPGIEHTLTSNEMFHLPIQPQRFAVVGGGFIAVEFAGILNGLGSQVTQIVRRDHILRGFDEDLRQAVQDGMAHHGIEFLTKTMVTKVEKLPEGVRLQLNSGRTLEADAVLFATGRQPWLEGLGLEAVGVEIKAGAITVDESSRTSVPNIFAVGDCTDRVNLTPVAIAEGRAFADSEFGNTPRTVNHQTYASAVFGQPQAAAIGLTEAQARSHFGEEGVQIFQTRFRPMFYSLPKEEERTMMKLVVDKATDRVVGVHMVGPDAAEIIQGVAIAVTKGCTKADFDATMALHPTAAEELVTMT